MWHTDPDLTMQLERERQEEMIRNHQQRQAARRAAGNTSVLRTLLGVTGDALVSAGESLRRRSHNSSHLGRRYPGATPKELAF